MMNLKQYGYIETEPAPIDLIPGRVTEFQREQYTVITEQGEVTAVLKGAFYHAVEAREDLPCVGDFVFLEYNENGASRIAQLLPRHSKFSRADYSGHAAGFVKTILEQVVATNFNYVFIVSSLNWGFKVSRIMRYLTQTRQGGGLPVVILTKADLAPDFSTPLTVIQKIAPDVPVHAVSSHTGSGLEGLSEYLQPGKTVVLLGMSGVGKSSLLNALMNQEVMTVNAIREADSRGRHTTTHRQLFMLPSGAMVIDTPGMRELGLIGANDGISARFTDVEELFTQCRFNDCRHKTEPGCAVLAALVDGTLQQEHWERYLAQKRENKFANDKAGYLRGKDAQYKSLSIGKKNIRKNRGVKK